MIWLSSCTKQEQVCTAVLTTGSSLSLLFRQHCLLLNAFRLWLDAGENRDFCSSSPVLAELVIITRSDYMWMSVCCTGVGVHAWVWSDFTCVCGLERESEWANGRLSTVFRGVTLRRCGSWSLLFVLHCADLRWAAWSGVCDAVQPMCTDRGCFG